MTSLTILGGGSWGTALAIALAPRFGAIRLWVHEPELAQQIHKSRINGAFLPGFRLPANITVTSDLTAEGADLVVGVMPSQFARAVYSQLTLQVPVVSATKGLERGSLLRMSQLIGETQPGVPVAVLSGPTFAREIAAGLPAAAVIASSDADLAVTLQQALTGPSLRLYTNEDVAGVELGGALKNVIAIAGGVVQGLGLGHNALAALITRGLAEMTRLAVAAGGDPRTLAGLAGLGDLVLTCTGELSRNRRVGAELARGRSLTEILGSMQMVAEGVETTGSALELARRYGVELPITQQMDDMLHGRRSPAEAIRELMERRPKGE
ncbi:MAG: NAD(P)-dependent glycerol-3-phosphate dehydrogenase [Acidobacteria bacterium]|nr:NAD(P)-dependent glycerol-3-phosphate dehydrogenase [Acidobacteriota bacterium]